MRNIAKGREPASLTQHRATEFSDYDNYQDKDSLRAFLVTEQRGICCYCMRAILPSRDAMKIEHWHPQEDPAFTDEQLMYANLLASCPGGDGQRDSVRHCDTAKGMKLLSRNPANPDHHVEELVHFDAQGRITSTDAEFDLQLNTVLNLNAAHLKNSRIAQLRAFQKAFRIRGSLTRQQLNKIIGEWSGSTHANALRPFCGVIVYWAQKRLARM